MDLDEELATVSTVLLVVIIPSAIVQYYFYWKFRKSWIIAPRRFYSVLYANVASTLGAIITLMSHATACTCIWGALGFSFLVITQMFEIERNIMLYISSKLTEEVAQAANSQFGIEFRRPSAAVDTTNIRQVRSTSVGVYAEPVKQRSIFDDMKPHGQVVSSNHQRRYLQHRKFFVEEPLSPSKIICWVISLLFFIGLMLSMILQGPDKYAADLHSEECDHAIDRHLAPLSIVLYINTALRIFVGFKLKTLHDRLGIRTEMQLVSVLLALMSIAISIIAWYAEGDEASREVVLYIVTSILFHAYNCLSMGLVLFWMRGSNKKDEEAIAKLQISSRQESKQEIRKDKEAKLLERTLTSELVGEFANFLTKEYAMENLIFYQAVEKYQRNPSRDTATNIFTEFLSHDAYMAVNISSDSSKNSKKFFIDVAPTLDEEEFIKQCSPLLDVIQEEIFQLMKHDSFARFFRSAEYAQIASGLELEFSKGSG